MVTEADTCRTYVVPKLYAAGWQDEQIREQVAFTDGRIVVAGGRVRRRKPKRADYVLYYRRDRPLAVVEAKRERKLPGDGLQQAKDYAGILGLKFAYSTNGHGIVEHDFFVGRETERDVFPTPDELWVRFCSGSGLSAAGAQHALAPYFHEPGRAPRYYQDIAINRAVEAIVRGRRRVLLTLATGTGKTVVAFQVCWKLWSSGWNRTGEYRKPRILYLADRNVLVDDPKDKTFIPFGDARHKIEGGKAIKSRELYFATYQALMGDDFRSPLYKEYARDFFDLVIVDEAHRGSARDTSSWRAILDYFMPAVQLGMTATPLRDENRDTYEYFGNPIYTYSLRQGIEDGFLAPYRVHRVVTDLDAMGWRPSAGDLDRFGREIPDAEYGTRDFERAVALRARTEAIARHLTDFMRRTDRFAKTIVFCVDQEHADEMRMALTNLNADLVRRYPDYAARVTADEGDIGRGHLSNFQELERMTPTILTTSQLLTTGVDAPTCKNVVLARVINSMTDFKQIIGRGTRVREDYEKLFFNILDYTGSATRLFADPAFDGEPARIIEEQISADGEVLIGETVQEEEEELEERIAEEEESRLLYLVGDDDYGGEPRKYYYDGGRVEIVAHVVYELDADGRQLRVVTYSDYAGDKVRSLVRSTDELESTWRDGEQRNELLRALEERGVDLDELAAAIHHPDADPLDLLCNLAFGAPLRTRRERAERAAKGHEDFFDRYGPDARQILRELLDKYAEHGPEQLRLPDALKVPPISDHGNPMEIARIFGGAPKLKEAVDELERLIYAA